jgi:tetratricopeptide (TPR) repeat protein
MLENYAKSILAVMPSGSVYFGGTDPGRFAITFFRDVANSPDIFVITQNGLADARYADYLLLRYGTRLRLPSNADVQSAFEKFVAESGSRPRLPDEQITVKNGAMHVSGAASVMEINGILTKQIFENNKAQHEFYIEESYVIPWMYPYLEPHGPILKLNRQPLPQLDPAVAEKDRSFWSALAVNLSTSPTGQRTDEAHKVYAKLRSAIGGVYAYRHMASEAEAAFKQAAEIAPTLPEASFRLAQLYCETGRFDDAEATLEQFQARLPAPDSNTTEAIRQVRDLKLKAGKKQSQ